MIYFSKSDEDKFLELVEETGSEEKGLEAYMQWKCLTDLYFLMSEVLGLKDVKRMKRPLLDEQYPKNKGFHKWLADVLQTQEDTLIQVPRGHLKSEVLKCAVIQALLRNPAERIALFSITQDFVEGHLRNIKLKLQTPLLQRLFSDVIPPVGDWSKNTSKFLLLRPQGGVQDPQISVFGVGNSVTGRRSTIQFFDDLIDKDTVKTAEAINKTREWFSGVVPTLEPGGYRKMIGTPYHHSDLYRFIEEDEIFDKVYKRPIKENGEYVYKWWTDKVYKQASRGMTEYDKSCQYWINPMPVADQAFPPPQPTYTELPDEEFVWYMAVDPAATTAKYSDETAIVVAAVTGSGEVYITNSFHGKWPGNETAKKIIELTVRFKPRKVGIEFGLQEHLRYIIDSEKSNWEAVTKQMLPLFIEPVRITNRQNKFDRVNWTLGSFVREGKVHIHESCLDLIDQMDHFNKNYKGNDDLVDAAAMIFQLVEIFSFRNYTKQEFQYVPKDYFTFEDQFGMPGKIVSSKWEAMWVK